MLFDVIGGFNFKKDVFQNIRLSNKAIDFIVKAEGYIHQQNDLALHELDVLDILNSDVGYLLPHVVDEVTPVAEFLGRRIVVEGQIAQS